MAGIVRKAIAGALGGIVGTAAMDALWYARYRRGGGAANPLTWEFGGVDGWTDVSAPGQVGEAALKTALGTEPADAWAQPTQNFVHWSTGVGWGKIYGLVTGGRAGLAGGVGLGLVAWLTSYVVLPPLGIYKNVWEYDGKTLARDLSAHLLFGTVTAATVAVVRRDARRDDKT